MTFLNKLLVGTALTVAVALSAPASAMLVIPAGAPGTNGATGAYVDDLASLTTSDSTATTAELSTFLGAPDDDYTGIANAWIQYDLGGYRLVNGAGGDFNVYEVDNGSVEFSLVDILLSADGVTWYNADADTVTFVNLAGDELHGNASFRRSYDIGNALVALGVTELRYIRLDGTSGANVISGSNGFDPDSVGLVNFTAPPPELPGAVPEPASWALMIGGFALAGAAMRRRNQARMAFAG